MATQITLSVDDDTLKVIERLKDDLGARTNAQVIRKALAIARAGADLAGSSHVMRILNEDKTEVTNILLKA